MKRDWLQAATNAIRRNDHRNALAGAAAGVGAAIAIGGMEWFSLASRYPLVVIPFATSIVLVVGSPEVEPAQPRALIGGHVVATQVGLAVLHLTGPHAWAAAAAVGLAVLAMYVTGTFHLPAGINPLLVVCAGAGGRAAADRVCLCLAPMDPAPAMAAALAILLRYDGLALPPPSCSAKRSPSLASTTLR